MNKSTLLLFSPWRQQLSNSFAPSYRSSPVLNILPKHSLSVVVRSPDDDAQPAAELPEHDGCAAAPKPWSAQFPEGRHGRTDAKHNGPVPTDAIISGMGGFKSPVWYNMPFGLWALSLRFEPHNCPYKSHQVQQLHLVHIYIDYIYFLKSQTKLTDFVLLCSFIFILFSTVVIYSITFPDTFSKCSSRTTWQCKHLARLML